MGLGFKSARLIALQVLFVVLGAVAIALRLVARQISSRTLQWHDICCIISWVFMSIYATLSIITACYGMGAHINTLTSDRIALVLKITFATSFVYIVNVVFMRFSILLLYLSLFHQNKQFKHNVRGFMALVFLFAPISAVNYLNICAPVSKFWYYQEPGMCDGFVALGTCIVTINLAFDLILIFLPMPIIWRLKMPTRKKVAVSCIFCLGIINLGINISRNVVVVRAEADDLTYSDPTWMLLTVAEVVTGIFVSCIPTLGPLFKRKSFRGEDQPHPPVPQTIPPETLSQDSEELETDSKLECGGSTVNLENARAG